MTRHPSTRFVAVAIGITLGLFGAAPSVRAQAWTPAQGEGTVSVQFQDTFIKYHLLPTVRRDRGQIRGETLLADVTYGITDKVAVSLALPFVASSWKQGGEGKPHNPEIDDGRFHSTFQDFQFGIRYNVSRKGVVFTPFAGTILPSHAYEYYAHAAAGRHVRELQVGTYWAKLLDPVLPGLFLQGRYSYGFAERIVDISHNRSNLDLEAGYFVKPELRVFAMGAGQLTHGGVDLNGNSRPSLGEVLWFHHDQIGRDNYLNVGAGLAYDLTPAVGIYGSVIGTGRRPERPRVGSRAVVWHELGFRNERGGDTREPGDACAGSRQRRSANPGKVHLPEGQVVSGARYVRLVVFRLGGRGGAGATERRQYRSHTDTVAIGHVHLPLNTFVVDECAVLAAQIPDGSRSRRHPQAGVSSGYRRGLQRHCDVSVAADQMLSLRQ